MAANGISELSTKQARQTAKLNLAQVKRQGYSTIVQNTTAYTSTYLASPPPVLPEFAYGKIKITTNDAGAVYLQFQASLPTITNQLKIGTRVVLDWDGRPGNTVATIAGPSIDFPGNPYPGDPGFLLTIITTTELPGNSEAYNIEALYVPNGTFAGSGSPDTTKVFYRARNTYDITQLPDTFATTGDDNANTGGLVEGRPWISAPTYTIVTSGLRLHLDAGNTASYTSGTTWTDLSANTNNATLVGSPDFTSAGTSSYFLLIDGEYATTSYTKYSGTYTGKTTFFVARISPSMADGYHAIFGVTTGDRTFNTYIYKTGSNYQVHASFGGISSGLSNTLTLTNDQWFTFGATQAANGDYTFYCNGQAVGVTTGQTFTNTYSSGTNPQLIGKADNYWKGDVAVVTVYDRALSGAEMTQNHNAIVGRYGL